MAEEKKTTKKDDKTAKVAAEKKDLQTEEKIEKETTMETKEEAKTKEEKSPQDKENEKESEKKVIKKVKKRKFRRQVQRGCAFIKSSYNNTVVSFTDLHGNMLAWSSSGLLGFKGAKKATTYAATQVVTDVHEKCQKYGLKDIEVFIKGVGSGREAALRSLAQRGYNIIKIKDITPIPHNGCRPKKPRRV